MNENISPSANNGTTDIKFTKLEIVQQNSVDELQRKLLSAS